MGKYSKPATFAGQKRAGPAASEQQPTYPKIDWAKEVDERVDVIVAIWEHAGVDLGKSKGSRRQLNGRCPYPDCTSKEDAFMVWADRSPKTKNHYHCRKCGKAGDIIQLLQDLKGWSFVEVLGRLGLLSEESAQPRRTRVETPVQKQQREWEEKAREQTAMLRHLYQSGRMQAALAAYERPRAYLASRGITLEQAQAYGLAYLPAPQENGQPADKDLWRWQGRIIFPLTSPGSEDLTFAGRTLALWQPGMSPAEHKAAIEAYNEMHPERQIIRMLKTSPCGFFGYREAIAHSELVFVEGEFDALSLLLAGVQGVIAVGTTGLQASLIPLSVESAVLAMDADGAGRQAAQKLTLLLEKAGLETPRQVVPAGGKDWNDMLIAGQLEDIRKLFASSASTIKPVENEQTEQLTCTALDANQEPELPERCADCGVHIESPDRDFFYVPRPENVVLLYCVACRNPDTCQPWPGEGIVCAQDLPEPEPVEITEEMRQGGELWEQIGRDLAAERDAALINRLAAAFPDCTVSINPPGYTLADRVHDLAVRIADHQGPVNQRVTRPAECDQCTSTTNHPSTPPWYTGRQHDRTQTWWQKFVRSVGQENAARQRQTYLDGFTDVRGNRWCGHCFHRCQVMNLGEQLGYPDAYSLYSLPETRGTSGYDAWLRLAISGNDALIETLERAARQHAPVDSEREVIAI